MTSAEAPSARQEQNPLHLYALPFSLACASLEKVGYRVKQALLTTRLRVGQVAQILRDTRVGAAALTQAALELLPLPVPQPPWRRPTFEAPKQPEPPRSISEPTSPAASKSPAGRHYPRPGFGHTALGAGFALHTPSCV